MNRTISIFLVAYTLLLVAAAAGIETALWGASAWRSVSMTAAAVLGAALLLLLVRRVRRAAARIIGIPGRLSGKAVVALSAAGLVLMWLLRSRHFIWGDAWPTAMAVESGATAIPPAPLATALSRGFFEIVNGLLFWNALETSALLSVIAGLLFALAVRASLRITGGRFPSMMVAVAAGSSAVFFGTGGTAPVAAAGTALFVYLALLRASGARVPLFVPVLAALAATALHLSNIFLAIPAVYLLVSEARKRENRMEVLGAAATAAVCLAAAALVINELSGPPGLLPYISGAASRALSSLSGSGISGTAGLAFNSLVLAGPAAALAIVLSVTGRKTARGGGAELSFLAVTAVSALIFLILAAPKVRGGLRWDLIVPAASVMALYAAALLRRLIPTDGEFREAAAVIVSLGIFHTAALVAVSSSPVAGERRILDLPLPPGRAETILGAAAWHERDFEGAVEWWSDASGRAPENAEVWYRLGSARMKLDDPLDAITDFHRATSLEPGNHLYRKALAEAYIEQRWYTEASTELESLVAEFPDSSRLWTRLGYARNHGNMYAEAVEAYERALTLEPDNRQYVRNLTSAVLNRGAELQKEGDFDGARKMYRYARSLYPGDWVSLNNLATLEMELEQWDSAYNILSAALKEHQGISQLHFNMSIVLEKLGSYGEAFEHLGRAAALDPYNPPAAEHFERLRRKIEEETPGD